MIKPPPFNNSTLALCACTAQVANRGIQNVNLKLDTTNRVLQHAEVETVQFATVKATPQNHIQDRTAT